MKQMIPPFDVNIRWSPADKAFVAEAPELPGCMADGSTRREALVNVERVIREWIETAQAEGRPIPKPGIHAARA
jgi:predicted RNase H-like HicB family nuclease